jgi:hypothetical protein
MPFVKGDPRINRKGRPRDKAPPVENVHVVEDHAKSDFVRWSRKNEFTRARFHMAIYWPHSWAAIEKLIKHGVIIRHEDESLEWTLNRESLVDLFYEWPWETPFFGVNVKWGPVETAFNIKRHTLRFYVSKHGGSRYYQDGDTNPDYEKVIKILENS